MTSAALKILEAITNLPEGIEVVIPTRGDFEMTIIRLHEGFDITHRRTDKAPKNPFWANNCYSTVGTPDGAGRFIPPK